jgi:hypothetical protein
MTIALEDRFNPTVWATLLDAALPAIDAVYATEKEKIWTLGGGTAIALRLAHRLSDDIDIFMPGIALKRFTPALNPSALAISSSFQWPGHYIKFETPRGEVDFLSPPLQTEPGYSIEQYKGRSIALETIEEVIVKKVRFRAQRFTHRDAFDLAAVARDHASIKELLVTEVGDRLLLLAHSVKSLLNDTGSTVPIRPTAAYQDLASNYLSFAYDIVHEALGEMPRV